ncbi:MAG: hypothetical protein AAFO07_02705 [Bacteroidota bacterium]
MKKSEKIYKDLREKYSDEEIVESFFFNDDDLDEEEQRQADKEFRELRLNQLKNMSESEILFGKLMKIKFRIRTYLRENKFEDRFTFSNQLRQYADILNKTKKEFAADLSIHQTKFSRLLNGKEQPNIDLMYRLEEHSSGEIPAHYWWRLFSLEFEHKMKTDLERKISESKKVKNQIEIHA